MRRLKDIGEQALVERLAGLFSSGRSDIVGIGDDAAVVPAPSGETDLVLTTDPVTEFVHFERGEEPERIGRKAVGRVLSDLAAMGAEPLWILADLVAPPDRELDAIEAAARGMAAAAAAYGASIIGGDTSGGPSLSIHVFGMGSVPRGTAVLRSGALPGDVLCVTGSLGGSRTGRHLDFEPCVREGIWLREEGVSAMIDVTDGLWIDGRRLAQASGVGAVLEAAALPVSPGLSRLDASEALERALTDGEDYELLFAVGASRVESRLRRWRDRFSRPCRRIGRVTDARGRFEVAGTDGRPVAIAGRGFNHFQSGP